MRVSCSPTDFLLYFRSAIPWPQMQNLKHCENKALFLRSGNSLGSQTWRDCLAVCADARWSERSRASLWKC